MEIVTGIGIGLVMAGSIVYEFVKKNKRKIKEKEIKEMKEM
jgi:hypothetical protein